MVKNLLFYIFRMISKKLLLEVLNRAIQFQINFALFMVHGQVVRVLDLQSLVPHCCGFESRDGLWNFIFSLQNVGGSTQVPARV